MKHFLFQVILFIFLPMACALGVCEYILRSVPNDHIYKQSFIITNRNNIKILSFGSSHGYYGIQPKFFSKAAFNMAFVSQSLKYDKFLYENLSKRGKAIRRNRIRAKTRKSYENYVPTKEDHLKWYGKKKRILKDTLTITKKDSTSFYFINTK